MTPYEWAAFPCAIHELGGIGNISSAIKGSHIAIKHFPRSTEPTRTGATASTTTRSFYISCGYPLLVATALVLHNVRTTAGDVSGSTQGEAFAREYREVSLQEWREVCENLETVADELREELGQLTPLQIRNFNAAQWELVVLRNLEYPHKEMRLLVVEELVKRPFKRRG
ncbi:hypothetical protein BDK51DRAFT_44117 [Blyttiomyces helicus]|uniref:Uncharacterized protein n=1 Tax=Blyttiomyces helicus TaxID=388810 RepID=A0A4P9VX12_9FUNG|nr:hypothetical protein BDK51DRAFT_44117 [Blyttiomyces helicus]|eukprot:RKO82808.1 hypothetical protein BDK51DRAFT_44117 [Blyttiomyces helicus]